MHKDKGCLSETEMGAYLEGRLTAERKVEIEKLLADCPRCLEEVVLSGRLVSEPYIEEAADLPERAVRRAVAIRAEKGSVFDAVISLMKDTISVIRSSPLTSWSYVEPALGLRHTKTVSPSMVILTRTFNGIRAELDIEQIAECLCNLKVKVTSIFPDASLKGIRVELFSEGRELASDFLVDGHVMFEDIGCGNYVVSVRRKDAVFGELTLRIE